MNVYFFELKAQFRSFITWTLSLVVLCATFIGAVLPMYLKEKDALQSMLNSFPESFSKIFGISGQNIFGFEGYYTFVFLYLGMAAAIMAVSFSVSIFYREKRTKSLDFLLVKPRTRRSLFLAKFAACLTLLVLANVFYLLTFTLMTRSELPELHQGLVFYLSGLSLFFTQILFTAFGIAYAVYAKRIRSIAGTATSFGLVGFVLFSASNLINVAHADLFSPLSYFSPKVLFEKGSYDFLLVSLAVTLVLVCLGWAYFAFVRGDAQAE